MPRGGPVASCWWQGERAVPKGEAHRSPTRNQLLSRRGGPVDCPACQKKKKAPYSLLPGGQVRGEQAVYRKGEQCPGGEVSPFHEPVSLRRERCDSRSLDRVSGGSAHCREEGQPALDRSVREQGRGRTCRSGRSSRLPGREPHLGLSAALLCGGDKDPVSVEKRGPRGTALPQYGGEFLRRERSAKKTGRGRACQSRRPSCPLGREKIVWGCQPTPFCDGGKGSVPPEKRGPRESASAQCVERCFLREGPARKRGRGRTCRSDRPSRLPGREEARSCQLPFSLRRW